MAGLEDPTADKKTALVSGLLQAVSLYLVYLALSLTDLWGLLPSAMQVITYGLLALAMIYCIMRGLMARVRWPLRRSLKAIILSSLSLAMAGALAGPDSKRLLEIAVKPQGIFSYPAPEISMMVTPPDYSGRAEFSEILMPGNEKASGLTPIPEGSRITIRAANMAYAPLLIAGKRPLHFQPSPDGGYTAAFDLTDEISWQVREGTRKIGEWPIFMMEDMAPIIKKADFQQIMTGAGLFSLTLDLSDDYGLDKVSVGVMASGASDKALSDRTELAISGIKTYSGRMYIGLGTSDFAGKLVDLIIEARDQAGQKQTKIISGITLPEREFSNPLSRQIMEIRTAIKAHPDQRKQQARRLMALGLAPDDGRTPAIYYMALRTAYWRLTNAKGPDDINNTRKILWDLANRMDGGERGQFSDDMLALLASLKLSLYQHQDIKDVKKQLQEIDKKIIFFKRHNPMNDEYDIKEMRVLYSKILKYLFQKKFDQAIPLVSYLERGFIYHDRGILSGQGYARFKVVSLARKQIDVLEKTQRQIMSFVFKNAVPLEVASLIVKKNDASDSMAANLSNKFRNWISIQKKLGASVARLGEILEKGGIDTTSLTAAARTLAHDTAQSMEAGDLSTASANQSQIMTLLKSLRKRLDREHLYNFARPTD
ncbi:MAG: DUF4175 domain-containing protein [Alphaproteobacteria bacterium]|nr:DUF4175 domain-containing protein [Alphaproteobacteria bacterium]